MPVNLQGILKIVVAVALAIGASNATELAPAIPYAATIATVGTALIALFMRRPQDPPKE